MDSTISIIDSHTAGEPTRVIIEGGPHLGKGPVADRLALFRSKFDHVRSAVVNEPRGSDVIVGALLCTAEVPSSTAAVIFFNNVGYLGMCGHGLIGVVKTLHYLGKIDVGNHPIDTPVGTVVAELHADGAVSIENVVSYRSATDVQIKVPGIGNVVGDVAWGGNWFYLVKQPQIVLDYADVNELTRMAQQIRVAINRAGFPKVDHVELYDKPLLATSDARNFVLCPGGQYDRSPCGTGTSAKLACLAADQKLQPGQMWTQEGILGTSFCGQYRWHDQQQGQIVPIIKGQAFVTAEAKLIQQSQDPFYQGIRVDLIQRPK